MFMTFHLVGNGIIIPTDSESFVRGVGIPGLNHQPGHYQWFPGKVPLSSKSHSCPMLLPVL